MLASGQLTVTATARTTAGFLFGGRLGPGLRALTAGLSPADEAQREALCATLRAQRGNISAVARAMNKDRKQIQRWIKRYAIDLEQFK